MIGMLEMVLAFTAQLGGNRVPPDACALRVKAGSRVSTAVLASDSARGAVVILMTYHGVYKQGAAQFIGAQSQVGVGLTELLELGSAVTFVPSADLVIIKLEKTAQSKISDETGRIPLPLCVGFQAGAPAVVVGNPIIAPAGSPVAMWNTSFFSSVSGCRPAESYLPIDSMEPCARATRLLLLESMHVRPGASGGPVVQEINGSQCIIGLIEGGAPAANWSWAIAMETIDKALGKSIEVFPCPSFPPAAWPPPCFHEFLFAEEAGGEYLLVALKMRFELAYSALHELVASASLLNPSAAGSGSSRAIDDQLDTAIADVEKSWGKAMRVMVPDGNIARVLEIPPRVRRLEYASLVAEAAAVGATPESTLVDLDVFQLTRQYCVSLLRANKSESRVRSIIESYERAVDAIVAFEMVRGSARSLRLHDPYPPIKNASPKEERQKHEFYVGQLRMAYAGLGKVSGSLLSTLDTLRSHMGAE